MFPEYLNSNYLYNIPVLALTNRTNIVLHMLELEPLTSIFPVKCSNHSNKKPPDITYLFFSGRWKDRYC